MTRQGGESGNEIAMRFAVVITLLALALMALPFFTGPVAGGLLIWLGIDFLLFGIAHALGFHHIFGKRADGALTPWSWLLFGPFHALSIFIWHAYRLLNSAPAWHRVSDHFYIGRRLLPAEYENLCRQARVEEFANYIDLTAEFSEPAIARKKSGYVAFPILDGSAPTVANLHTAISQIRPGKTYVHCAQGYGRTGLFALAFVLSSEKGCTITQGLRFLASVRLGVHLNAEQMNCIAAFQIQRENGTRVAALDS